MREKTTIKRLRKNLANASQPEFDALVAYDHMLQVRKGRQHVITIIICLIIVAIYL